MRAEIKNLNPKKAPGLFHKQSITAKAVRETGIKYIT
jgi:hypothetical protein